MAKSTRKRSFKKALGKRVRKAVKKAKSLSVPRNMVATGKGFPKKLIMTHKYQETINLVNTTGGFASYIFSANGIWDPNVTGTGHQPLYFDQLTTLYNHYVVVGSKCTFTFTPLAVYANPMQLAVLLEDGASLTSNDPNQIAEQTLAKKQELIPAGNNGVQHRTLKFSSKKTFGKNALANSNLRGSASTNPAEQSYFVIASVGNAVNTTGLQVIVAIEYSTIWFELKDVAQS